MATYYWVGGTGTWDGTTTTNWSLSSGGAGGAGVPTSADDAIFNSASNATLYTVTMAAGAVCSSLSMAGPASGNVTWAGTSALSIYGSLTLTSTGITRTYNGAITFAATTTGFTISSGISLASAITFNGVGGAWTLAAAFTTTGAVTFTNGTFSTANFAFSTGNCTNSGTGTTSISFGSSAVSVGNWLFGNTTGLTFNAGTSTITSGGNPSFGGLTYYNYTSTNGASNGSTTFTGGGTFNNLFNTAARLHALYFDTNITVNGTFTAAGQSGINNASVLRGGSAGQQITITAAAVSLSYLNINSIVAAGAAAPWTGTALGNGGNNSGITFTSPKTVYWNLVTGGDLNGNGWALTSGGTPSAANYPLPQDTAIFNNTGLNSGTTLSYSANTFGYYGFIADFSALTNTTTLTITSNFLASGNITLSSAVTMAGTGTIQFSNTATLTSAGKTLTQPITVVPGGTLTLSGALTTSNTIGIAGGTFTQASALTCGLITISNNGTWNANAAITNSAGITHTLGTVNTGTSITTTGTYTFSAGTLKLSAGNTLTVNAFVTSGTTLKYLISSTPGTQATIAKASGTTTATYLSIQDSNATGGTWNATATSNINAGNNTGWLFPSNGNFFFLF
jgi:hypothetical protein